MPAIQLTTHAQDVLKERKILPAWVWKTIESPAQQERSVDGNMHYMKPFKQRAGRVLHGIINDNVVPNRIVTVFFDRRLRKQFTRPI